MAGQSQTLYRKWRSQTFGDLVGQDAVVQTLRQAVAQGRLTHAYLFCGPRGTGKTSAARLLAKMVNCQNPRDGEPCNECLPCTEITEGRSTDVFEIDAASNRGIDEIRDLRERVRISATPGHYKVYIIDEVHMLTTEAFNALLKTLEEPPPHVIFVLATTEANKVPATVVSRCQHFDFRRIGLRDIIDRLAFVCGQEQIQAEPLALELLARAAQGGMRDALSLLDQARAFAGDTLSSDAVRGMLGMADPTLVRELITFVAAGDTAAGLHRINDLAQSGIDLRQLASQIAELWRQLMLARAGADVARLLDILPEEAADLKSLSERFTLETLTECARIFARNDAGARVQVVPQLALELAFLDCVAALQGHAAPRAAAPIAAMPTPLPAQAASPPALHIVPPTTPPPPMPTREMPPPTPITAANGHKAKVEEVPASLVASAPETPAPAIREAASNVSYAPASAAGQLFAQLSSQWDLIRKLCKQHSASTAGLLADAYPVAIETGAVTTAVIVVKYEFHLNKLSQPNNRQNVEWAIKEALEIPCETRFINEGEAARYGAAPQSQLSAPMVPPATPSQESAPRTSTPTPPNVPTSAPQPAVKAAPTEPPADPRALAQRDPLVQALQREFGARILDVRPQG